MNEDNKNLPDREMANRNSVYKLAGQDDSSLQDMPDRKMNERNSVYKLAEEAKQKYGTPDVAEEPEDTTIRGDKERDNADHARMGNPANPATKDTSGRTQYGEDRGGATTDNQYSTQSGGQSRQANQSQQFGTSRNSNSGNGQALNDQENANSQTSRMGSTDTMGGQRDNTGQAGTNSLPETVKLDEDTLDGPSKLDAATNPNAPMPSATRYSAPVKPNPTRDRDVDMNVERDIPAQTASSNTSGLYTEPKRRTDDASQSYPNDRPRLVEFDSPEDSENDRDNGIRTQQ